MGDASFSCSTKPTPSSCEWQPVPLASVSASAPDANCLTALTGCAALHTLNLTGCYRVTDVSALANCAELHTLDLSRGQGEGPYGEDGEGPVPALTSVSIASRMTRT